MYAAVIRHALTICLLLASTATAQVSITLDAQQVVRPVPTRFFGINTAIWDDAFSSPPTVDLLARMEARILRFPGGSAADEYHWANNRSEGSDYPWPTDFNAFTRTALILGAEMMVTVNYGTGSAEEAADWVQAANINSQRAVRYWEIGNEVYGSWEPDKHSRPHDPRLYAEEAAQYIAKMKRVDPTIRVGVVVVSGEDSYPNYEDEAVTNPRTGIERKGWTPVMLTRLRELEVRPDFVSWHRYEQAPFDEDDGRLLSAPGTWPDEVASLRQHLNDYLGSAASSVEIFCTETNSVFSRPGKQSVSLVNALYLADSLGQALQTEVRSVIWWTLRNAQEFNNNNSPALYGWRMHGDYGLLSPQSERYPTSYLAVMVSAFARPGDRVISATSSSPLLTAYAVKRSDESLAVLMINKSPDQTLNVSIQSPGFTPVSGDLPLWSYGMGNDLARADITRSAARATGTAIALRTTPYSANYLVMGKAEPAPPPPVPARQRAVRRR